MARLRAVLGHQLIEVIKKCNGEESTARANKVHFDKETLDLELWSKVISRLTNTFKELDEVDPNFLHTIYEYRENNEKEEV